LKIILKKISLVCICLSLALCHLIAESMSFNINYLGVSVAKVNMSVNKDVLLIKAKSTDITNFLSDSIDNTYKITFNDSFLPLTYEKNIIQAKYKEKSITAYNYDNASYKDLNANTIYEYQIKPNSRDIFSALIHLRRLNLKKDHTMNLEVNRNLWQVKSTFMKIEKVNTILGKKDCLLVKLDFKKTNINNNSKSDILTNNLVNENNSLYFWFTDDDQRIPIKAKYEMSPFSVIWLLTNYTN